VAFEHSRRARRGRVRAGALERAQLRFEGLGGDAARPQQATTVDSTPTRQAPPSSTAAMRPSSSSSTCSAVVGLTRPERLALGAAIGRPTARMSARGKGCAGTRSARLSSPALASSDTGQSGARGSTSVSGSGQKRSASIDARSSKTTSRRAAAASMTWMMSGLNCGLAFAAKIAATATSFVASAPRP
jgi:hypothetical protein